MAFGHVFIVICIIAAIAYFLSTRRALSLAKATQARPASLLKYYGQNALIWSFVPAIILLILFTMISPAIIDMQFSEKLQAAYPDQQNSMIDLMLAQIENISLGAITNDDPVLQALSIDYLAANNKALWLRAGLVVLLASLLAFVALLRIDPKRKARLQVEVFMRRLFFASACVAVLTTIGIIASILFESVRFFADYPITDFLFGTHWSPNIAISEGQSGSSGSFGMIPVLAGTLMVAFIAMAVALPVGLLTAIYLAEFASQRVRSIIKPTLEILAGIPTVVYGFFAALTAAPFFRQIGLTLGLDVSSESALAAGAVMGVMIIPFISSLSDDVINAVPQSLRDGSLGLGATKGETIIKVVLPAAFPGIVGAFLLAVSRAIGETMIVVMAAGLTANLTANPLESVTTVTVQIVSLLTGDTEFDSIKTLSAFALGLTLFFATLMMNILALTISRRMAENYD